MGTREQVRDHCHTLGGELASIHNALEEEIVSQHCSRYDGKVLTFLCYVGLFRRSHSAPFRWDDGSTVTWTNWAPGEPGTSEKAVVMSTRRWQDWDDGWALIGGV